MITSNRAEYNVLDVLNADNSAIIVRPAVNSVVLEIDTRSAIAMIQVDVYQSKFANCQLQSSNKLLRSFTDESVPCKGMFKVNGSTTRILETWCCILSPTVDIT